MSLLILLVQAPDEDVLASFVRRQDRNEEKKIKILSSLRRASLDNKEFLSHFVLTQGCCAAVS